MINLFLKCELPTKNPNMQSYATQHILRNIPTKIQKVKNWQCQKLMYFNKINSFHFCSRPSRWWIIPQPSINKWVYLELFRLWLIKVLLILYLFAGLFPTKNFQIVYQKTRKLFTLDPLTKIEKIEQIYTKTVKNA